MGGGGYPGEMEHVRDYSDLLPAEMMSALNGGWLPIKATHIKALHSQCNWWTKRREVCAISVMLTNGHPVWQQNCLHTTNYLRLCIVSGTPSDETCGLVFACNVAELP